MKNFINCDRETTRAIDLELNAPRQRQQYRDQCIYTRTGSTIRDLETGHVEQFPSINAAKEESRRRYTGKIFTS